MLLANSAPENVSYPAMSMIDEMQMRLFECKDVQQLSYKVIS